MDPPATSAPLMDSGMDTPLKMTIMIVSEQTIIRSLSSELRAGYITGCRPVGINSHQWRSERLHDSVEYCLAASASRTVLSQSQRG